MEKTLEKDYAERLSQETKKAIDSINNTNNKNISDVDDFLGKIQNAFISAADIILKRIFVIKIILKNKNNENGTTQIVNKCEKTLTGCDAYLQKILITIFLEGNTLI